MCTAINLAARKDIPTWSSNLSHENHPNKLNIFSTVNLFTCQQIKKIGNKYWDCFDAKGLKFPMLHFESTVDKGTLKLVSYPQLNKTFFKQIIIPDQLDSLVHNGWIEPASSLKGSMVVIAQKSPQEEIANIMSFFWKVCNGYYRLNTVTLPFQYAIPICNNSIHNFGEHHNSLYFISLITHSGYHQASVHLPD